MITRTRLIGLSAAVALVAFVVMLVANANTHSASTSVAGPKPPLSFDEMQNSDNPVVQPPYETFLTTPVCGLYYMGNDESYLETPYGLLKVSTQFLVDNKIVIEDTETFTVDTRGMMTIVGVAPQAFPFPPVLFTSETEDGSCLPQL